MRVCVCSAEEAVTIARDDRDKIGFGVLGSRAADDGRGRASAAGHPETTHYLAGGYGAWTARR